MSLPPPPAAPSEPRFVDCGETSITIEWDADPALSYKLQYKEYPQPWEQASVVAAGRGQGRIEASVPDLQPCSTYNLRLVAVGPDGGESAPGPEIVVDTQAANCTPKPRKGCCVC